MTNYSKVISRIFQYAQSWSSTAKSVSLFSALGARGQLQAIHVVSPCPSRISLEATSSTFVSRDPHSASHALSPLLGASAGLLKLGTLLYHGEIFVHNFTNADMLHQRVHQSGGTPGTDTRGFGSLVVHVEAYRLSGRHR